MKRVVTSRLTSQTMRLVSHYGWLCRMVWVFVVGRPTVSLEQFIVMLRTDEHLQPEVTHRSTVAYLVVLINQIQLVKPVFVIFT